MKQLTVWLFLLLGHHSSITGKTAHLLCERSPKYSLFAKLILFKIEPSRNYLINGSLHNPNTQNLHLILWSAISDKVNVLKSTNRQVTSLLLLSSKVSSVTLSTSGCHCALKQCSSRNIVKQLILTLTEILRPSFCEATILLNHYAVRSLHSSRYKQLSKEIDTVGTYQSVHSSEFDNCYGYYVRLTNSWKGIGLLTRNVADPLVACGTCLPYRARLLDCYKGCRNILTGLWGTPYKESGMHAIPSTFNKPPMVA